MGVEEAALQTTSLPWNLELKAGRFFGEFGKLSYIHDHELPFVNRPLALDQYVGGESRTDGAQVNWLPPFAHYVSLTGGFGVGFPGVTSNDLRRCPGRIEHFVKRMEAMWDNPRAEVKCDSQGNVYWCPPTPGAECEPVGFKWQQVKEMMDSEQGERDNIKINIPEIPLPAPLPDINPPPVTLPPIPIL